MKQVRMDFDRNALIVALENIWKIDLFDNFDQI